MTTEPAGARLTKVDKIATGEIVRWLREDRSSLSGWVTDAATGLRSEPSEIHIRRNGASLWVRADGSWASGWAGGNRYFGQHFGRLGAWRIRRAVRRWSDRRRALAGGRADG